MSKRRQHLLPLLAIASVCISTPLLFIAVLSHDPTLTLQITASATGISTVALCAAMLISLFTHTKETDER